MVDNVKTRGNGTKRRGAGLKKSVWKKKSSRDTAAKVKSLAPETTAREKKYRPI